MKLDEAIKILELKNANITNIPSPEEDEAFRTAMEYLKYIEPLQNRCFGITQGVFCSRCNMKCKHKG